MIPEVEFVAQSLLSPVPLDIEWYKGVHLTGEHRSLIVKAMGGGLHLYDWSHRRDGLDGCVSGANELIALLIFTIHLNTGSKVKVGILRLNITIPTEGLT